MQIDYTKQGQTELIMWIYKDKVIFFHNPKCAGNTILSLFTSNHHKDYSNNRHPGINKLIEHGAKIENFKGHPFIDGKMFWHITPEHASKYFDIEPYWKFTSCRGDTDRLESMYWQMTNGKVGFDSWLKTRNFKDISQSQYITKCDYIIDIHNFDVDIIPIELITGNKYKTKNVRKRQ